MICAGALLHLVMWIELGGVFVFRRSGFYVGLDLRYFHDIFPYGSYRNLWYCGETPPLTAGPGHASVVLPRCRLTAVTIRQTSRGGASSRPVACPVPPATLGYLNCSPPVRMHSLLRYCMQTRVNCLSPGLPPLTTLDDLSLAWWPCT